jgi:hypothetical protein
METIEIKTLIDITNSGVRRANQGTQQQLDQYKNWTTLNQCLGIRSNIEYDSLPTVETTDVKGLGFGAEFKGKQKVWTWRFQPDRSRAFSNNDNIIGTLLEDLDQVPVIKKLNETVNIDRAVFDISDSATRNTIVTIIPGNS